MLATVINVVLVLLGSALGLLFKNRISARLTGALTTALGLCVLGIGVSSAVGTQDTLCVIVCMVIGTVMGEALNIEGRMEGVGEALRRRLRAGQGENRFVEGFVSASVLFCVGAMAVNGSLEAGINHNYAILVAKGVIDGITSVSFAAAMGVGVAFSVVPLFLYQGALTLIFSLAGPVLPAAVVTEMSAVGGTVIVAIAINMLGLGKEKVRVGNMLPAIFLPILYVPLSTWLAGLMG